MFISDHWNVGVKVFVNVFLAKASYTITAKCVVYKYILVLGGHGSQED